MRVVALVGLAACSFRPGGVATATDGRVALDVVFMDAPPPLDAAPPDWWDPHWRWRMKLTIANGSSSPLPIGYQVGVPRDLGASPCSANRDDIRIVRGMAERARVIDEVGPPQWTWFPLEAAIPTNATSQDYWLYCGNPAPTPSPRDPKIVFDFFDDFNKIGRAHV